MRFDTRNRNEASDADVESLCNLGDIQIRVFEHRIKPVLAVVVEQLSAEIAQTGGEAVTSPKQSAEVESPIDVIGLNRVGKAFHVEHRLVELGPIREDVIGGRIVRIV